MTRSMVLRLISVVALIAFLAFWLLQPTFSTDEKEQLLWTSLATRLLGSIVFAALFIDLGYSAFGRFRLSHLALLIPCLAVVVNNLPILSLAWGDAVVERTDLIWLFALDCLLIGIFEELAFRGTLFLFILEKRRGSTKQIFWTTVIASALFGVIHLANLFEGAGVVATLLQVGYSFLIGGMCSIVLLKTGNLLYCILLHAVYDFCGGLLPTLGGGTWWDMPTVIFTAILAVGVCIYLLCVLLRMPAKEADALFLKKENEICEHEEN